MKNSVKVIFATLLLIGCKQSDVSAQALNFGAYSYVTLGTILQANHSYTKEAWVKVYPTSAVHGRNFISSYDHPFWLENGMLSAANSYGDAPHAVSVQDKQAFPLNQWVHIAVTYDPHNTTMVLYKNGKVVAVDSFVHGFERGIIQLGADASGDFLDGTDMDEVRIWGVALTQAQIQANMNCDVQPQDGLLAYYKFDEGTPGAKNKKVLSVTDYSGHSNNGAFFNFSLAGAANNYIKGRINKPTPAISGSDAVCTGSPITLKEAATGGTWSSSNTSVAIVNATGLVTAVTNGQSAITYTAANGCVVTKTVSVYESPTVAAVTTDANEGGVKAAVSGGTPAFSYCWNNGAATQSLSAPETGSYNVLVTDAHGCTATGNYTIVKTAALPTEAPEKTAYTEIQKP